MINTALDESQEKKDLRREIITLEKNIASLMEKIEQTKNDVAQFESLYDEKIAGLQRVLIDLDRVLEKYTAISSHIDEFFSFDEASKIFDEVMDDSQKIPITPAAMPQLSPSQQHTLKQLYRKLARQFHPDIAGGNAAIMMQINYAYAHGDQATLEDIERNHVPKYVDTRTLFGLTMRLAYLKQIFAQTQDELRMVRKSEMYKMLKSFLKKRMPMTEILETLADSLKKNIEQKKQQVKMMKDQFETMQTNPENV